MGPRPFWLLFGAMPKSNTPSAVRFFLHSGKKEWAALGSQYFFLDKKVPKKSMTYSTAALEKDLTCGKSETHCVQTVGLSYCKQGLFPSLRERPLP